MDLLKCIINYSLIATQHQAEEVLVDHACAMICFGDYTFQFVPSRFCLLSTMSMVVNLSPSRQEMRHSPAVYSSVVPLSSAVEPAQTLAAQPEPAAV